MDNCSELQEETVTDGDGTYRLRGLQVCLSSFEICFLFLLFLGFIAEGSSDLMSRLVPTVTISWQPGDQQNSLHESPGPGKNWQSNALGAGNILHAITQGCLGRGIVRVRTK